MGVIYSIVPLNAELRQWLEGNGFPDLPVAHGRWPTLNEIKTALSSLTAESIAVAWDSASTQPEADLTRPDGAWTALRVTNFAGDDLPCQFYFSKGWPELVTAAICALVQSTGPLVIFPDTGSDIQVVHVNGVITDPSDHQFADA